MNLRFSNSTTDLDDRHWPMLSFPRGSITRFAERLRQKGPGSVRSAFFDVDVSFDDDNTTIALHGVLSAADCAQLSETVQIALDQRRERIVLDLRGIQHVGMAGVHALILAHLRASDELRELLLIPASPAVQHVIDAADGPFVYVNG
jgi:anti-anti-sigma regulatory factor